MSLFPTAIGSIGSILNRFRAGGASYPAVLDDGNTVAWFDSAENITKDGSNFVSVWGDKSGNSNDLEQATGTNQPLWSADGVLFDGVDNFIKTSGFTLAQPINIYMVIKQVSYTVNRYIFEGATACRLFQGAASGQVRLNGGASSSPASGLSIGTFGIIRGLLNGASSKVQANEGTLITGNFGALDMNGITIGSNKAGTGSWSNIMIKEIILRKVADTAPSEAAIYAYLADKHSIT